MAFVYAGAVLVLHVALQSEEPGVGSRAAALCGEVCGQAARAAKRALEQLRAADLR